LKSQKWIAVTAGVGSKQFEGAAKRIQVTLQNSRVVDRVVAVLTDDLPEICPVTSEIYADLMNPQTRGFGFMAWKAEIVNAAFVGRWGDFDGVIWIDAGCEVTINPISLLNFKRFQRYSKVHGVASFTLATQEVQYTKRDIFSLFPEIDPHAAGDQIQSTWMFLSGEKGRLISNQWLELVCRGTNLLDLSPSEHQEFPEFIENRYDQSTFSMVCKANQVKVMKYRPTTGSGSLISRIRGLSNPIWTARNRTPNTVKSRLHRLVEF
jgi:hypothetical protein